MEKKEIGVLGVSSDLGANIAGSRMGPDGVRVAGLHRKLQALDYTLKDYGNLSVPLRSYGKDGVGNYLSEITSLNATILESCLNMLMNNRIPLNIGGDHSMSIGTVAASSSFYPNLGLIWIDTHADMNNPETSETKNIHGMPVSTLLHNGYADLVRLVKRKLKPENIALIGLRDIDKHEAELLKESGVHYYTMRDVDELGIQGVFRKVKDVMLDRLEAIHVSFDLDVMDPIHAPGVSTAVHGGFSTREAHLILELIHETDKLVSCDFVELNPMNDHQGQTARLAVDLICSLFGSKII